MSKQISKGIFSLEASRENGRMKIGAYEKFSDDEKTIAVVAPKETFVRNASEAPAGVD